jgi:flagellar motor protein MotB
MPLRAPRGFIDERDPKVSQVGHPAPPWMSCYADLMTELVCFFVILYALTAALNKEMQTASRQIRSMIEQAEMAGDVKMDREGLKITLQEQNQASFFGSGSADTTPEMEAMLVKLSPTLLKLSEQHEIVIEGHTDNQAISNDFYDSNWELSTARATSVVRLMIDKFGFLPQKMAAVGYGQFRPIVPNDNPENRAKNRRVVFFVKNNPNSVAKAQPPPGGEAK